MKQKERCTAKTGTNPSSENTEQWKPIRGLEYYFSVSNFGNVKSRFKTLTPRITRGYYYVILEVCDGEFHFRRNVPIHRLVAQEFCDNRLGRNEVNHIDGNKTNNCATNLEWVSRSENRRHALALGLIGMPKGRQKFTRKQIEQVFALRKKNLFHKEIATRLGMGTSTVTHILNGTRRSKQ